MKKGEEDATIFFFNTIHVWDINMEIADEAANYILSYKKKGISLDFVDATIAATCKLHKLTLMTYNVDHYPMQEFKKSKMPPLTM